MYIHESKTGETTDVEYKFDNTLFLMTISSKIHSRKHIFISEYL